MHIQVAIVNAALASFVQSQPCPKPSKLTAVNDFCLVHMNWKKSTLGDGNTVIRE
jgi:hypothetical protein